MHRTVTLARSFPPHPKSVFILIETQGGKRKGKRIGGPESRVHDDFRPGRDTLESRGQRIEKRKADT